MRKRELKIRTNQLVNFDFRRTTVVTMGAGRENCKALRFFVWVFRETFCDGTMSLGQKEGPKRPL